jgi:hypothetical protein
MFKNGPLKKHEFSKPFKPTYQTTKPTYQTTRRLSSTIPAFRVTAVITSTYNPFSIKNGLNVYTKHVKSRRMRWAGHEARMGGGKEWVYVTGGKARVKRPVGRPRRRWVDNNRIDLGEVGWGWCGLDWPGSG